MDVLDKIVIGGNITARQASGVMFMGWVMKKLNNVQKNSPAVSELTMLANAYPGRVMDDKSKLDIIGKMKKAGIDV